jgi:hypothetical protein
MECPTCGIDNLPDTIRCECGFDFKLEKIEEEEKEHENKIKEHKLGIINRDRAERKKPKIDEDGQLICRKCGSKQLTSNKQGFGWKKGLGGAVLTGGVGLAAGFFNSNKVLITCLQCGHRWRPGKA